MQLIPAPTLAAVVLLTGPPLRAQTDFYNTDHGRPLTVEDAMPVERRALEFQAAPLRLERGRGGAYEWGVEPSLAWGALPFTQVEVGLPVAWRDGAGGATRPGLAGLVVSALHQLNTETLTLPALALSGAVQLPVGSLAPRVPYATGTAIATRTFAWGRLHANAQGTLGPEGPSHGARPAGTPGLPATAGPGTLEQARWMAGVALDHTFAVRSRLVGAEVLARRPLGDDAVEWRVGAGTRWQAGPRVALDVGAGRRVSGADPGWYVTFGSAYAFGVPRLPGGR